MLAIISDYLSGEDSENIQLNGYKQIAAQNNFFVGGMLMKKWKFSDDFVVPVIQCQTLMENQFMNECRLLHIANNMFDYFASGNIDSGLAGAMKRSGIKLSEKQLEKIKIESEKHYNEFSSVF